MPPDYVDNLNGFVTERVAAGIPCGSEDRNQNNIRVYPQLKPILIDWIRNFRTRLAPGFQWFLFLSSLKGLTDASGEQPEVLTALMDEFRNLCDLDFEKVIPPEQYDAQYKGTFIANFSLAITYAAGPADYDRLRELFFEPKSKPYRWSLLEDYFGKSKNKDLLNILAEAFNTGLEYPAAHIASLRGFTQFLPQVRDVAHSIEGNPNISAYWEDRIVNGVHRLEKKHYADTHKGSSVDDLIRDLDDDTVASYAAYVLGVRKDPAALEPLRRKVVSPVTRVRQEAKAAVKKVEKQVTF